MGDLWTTKPGEEYYVVFDHDNEYGARPGMVSIMETTEDKMKNRINTSEPNKRGQIKTYGALVRKIDLQVCPGTEFPPRHCIQSQIDHTLRAINKPDSSEETVEESISYRETVPFSKNQ